MTRWSLYGSNALYGKQAERMAIKTNFFIILVKFKVLNQGLNYFFIDHLLFGILGPP